MAKKSATERLKSFSWAYITMAVIIAIYAILANAIPAFSNGFKQYTGNENIMFEFTVTLVVNIIIYVWYFWLARRAADGTSKGTFFMILLVLGLISEIYSLFAGPVKGHGTVDLFLDLFGLWFLIKARQEIQ